jgi:hypothetical protein
MPPKRAAPTRPSGAPAGKAPAGRSGSATRGKRPRGGVRARSPDGADGGGDDDDLDHVPLAAINAAIAGHVLPAAEDLAADDEHSGVTTTFPAVGVRDWLDKQCAAMGFRGPTPVQAAAVPAILAGADRRVGVAARGAPG